MTAATLDQEQVLDFEVVPIKGPLGAKSAAWIYVSSTMPPFKRLHARLAGAFAAADPWPDHHTRKIW